MQYTDSKKVIVVILRNRTRNGKPLKQEEIDSQPQQKFNLFLLIVLRHVVTFITQQWHFIQRCRVTKILYFTFNIIRRFRTRNRVFITLENSIKWRRINRDNIRVRVCDNIRVRVCDNICRSRNKRREDGRRRRR